MLGRRVGLSEAKLVDGGVNDLARDKNPMILGDFL